MAKHRNLTLETPNEYHFASTVKVEGIENIIQHKAGVLSEGLPKNSLFIYDFTQKKFIADFPLQANQKLFFWEKRGNGDYYLVIKPMPNPAPALTTAVMVREVGNYQRAVEVPSFPKKLIFEWIGGEDVRNDKAFAFTPNAKMSNPEFVYVQPNKHFWMEYILNPDPNPDPSEPKYRINFHYEP